MTDAAAYWPFFLQFYYLIGLAVVFVAMTHKEAPSLMRTEFSWVPIHPNLLALYLAVMLLVCAAIWPYIIWKAEQEDDQ